MISDAGCGAMVDSRPPRDDTNELLEPMRHPYPLFLFCELYRSEFVDSSAANSSRIDPFGRLSQQSPKCFQGFPNLASVRLKLAAAIESTGRSNNPLLLKLSPEETGSIPRPGDSGACHSPTTDANANHESNNITGSEGARSMLAGGNHHRGTDPAPEDNPVVILDSEALETTTGNLSVLSSGTIHRHDGVLSPASREEMQTYTSGSVCFGRFKLNGVKYNPNVGNRIIVSGSELDKLDYYFEFAQGECIVLDLRSDEIVGKGRLVDEDYIMEFLEIPHNRAPESESLFSLE